jgi:nucleoid-associated protein YgaU
MTASKRLRFFFICTAAALFAYPLAGFAQTEMTYEEYKIQLAGYETRTAEAKRALAECRQMGENLSKQIADLDDQTAATKQEVFTLVESDETGMNAYLAELDRIASRLTAMLSLSDDALFEVRDELDGIKDRVKQMKAMKLSLLPKSKTKLKNIASLIERVDARMPAKKLKPYTVQRNDSLWKIARKPDIYNDPYLWPRIYVENRAKIKDPDLIYPNWVLNIPFGVDRGHHLVLRGQHLSAIAGIVYKDPAKWHRIFQANKTQILDPNLIFPAQDLSIPAN